MRVLVYGLSSDKLGGIETFLLNMNKFMSDDMIFDYVIEGTDTIHRHEIEEKGGDCYFISSKRRIFQNIRDWEKILKEYKPISSVIYFNMYSLAWSVPVFMSLINGYKVIVHAHNNSLHDCGVLLKFLHKVNRSLLGLTKIIRFTNSDLSTKFFFGNKPAELIYNAIDTNRFAYNEKIRNTLRKQLNVQGKNLYGFSGRLAYQKNPLFLMDIFAEIKKIDKNSAFIVCGDGNLAEQTKSKAEQLELNVNFTGNVKNMQDYYQAMDCYVLPSRFEGLGIVLIEAQCAGVPCITSENVVPDMTSITPYIKRVGFGNPKQWAKEAVQLVNQQGCCNRLMGYEYAKASAFNIEKEAPRLESIFLNL